MQHVVLRQKAKNICLQKSAKPVDFLMCNGECIHTFTVYYIKYWLHAVKKSQLKV
jgi:hypothetical protein